LFYLIYSFRLKTSFDDDENNNKFVESMNVNHSDR